MSPKLRAYVLIWFKKVPSEIMGTINLLNHSETHSNSTT